MSTSLRSVHEEITVAGFRRWCHKMKLLFFHEVELEFGNGRTHVDIRHGVKRYGPVVRREPDAHAGRHRGDHLKNVTGGSALFGCNLT